MASAEIQKDTHISGVDSGSTEYRRKSKDDASGVDGSYQSDTESVSTLMRGRRRSSNNNNTNYAGVNYEYIAEVPLDKYYIVWAIVFLLGVGVLLPWNVFITETAYFNERVHVKPVSVNSKLSFHCIVFPLSICLFSLSCIEEIINIIQFPS